MMEREVIRVENLSVSYRDVKAVDGVSFRVKEGTLTAIIGPNGSGKTSTVECIEGLRKKESGSVSVWGLNPVKDREAVYRKMGVQLQEASYPPKIRVEELCRLFASFYENPADWGLLLRQLDLEGCRRQYVDKLSGGQRQKLSILIALMGRPKVMILDELTTGLDPEIRQNIRRSFRKIKESGVSMILVSHYLDEVEELADQIVFLQKGKERFCGTKEEFRAYAKREIPEGEYPAQDTLENLYLKLCPKEEGITMEGIL